MPSKASRSKKRFHRWQRLGAGQCAVCQERPHWRYRVGAGVKDRYLLLGDTHRREFKDQT